MNADSWSERTAKAGAVGMFLFLVATLLFLFLYWLQVGWHAFAGEEIPATTFMHCTVWLVQVTLTLSAVALALAFPLDDICALHDDIPHQNPLQQLKRAKLACLLYGLGFAGCFTPIVLSVAPVFFISACLFCLAGQLGNTLLWQSARNLLPKEEDTSAPTQHSTF